MAMALCRYSKIVLQQLQQASKFHTCRSHPTMKEASSKLITKFKEIDIAMPYGQLAAKAWGNEAGKKVLALHGWFDNCGSFDKLIPLLEDKYYIVAVDAPGHGLSCHKPLGCLYSDIDGLLDLRKIVDSLGWEKFSILGHSFGASMGLFFSCIFPEFVEKMVSLDRIRVLAAPLSDFPEVTIKQFEAYLHFEKKSLEPPRVYKYEEARDRLADSLKDRMSTESLDIMLKRGIRMSDCGRGFVFNRDLRAYCIEYLNIKSVELMNQYMTGVKSELMLVLGKNSTPGYQIDDPNGKEEVFNIYRKNTKKFVLEYVEGNHFVHLDHPERVAPLINKFLGE